jgi:diacylglycerol kinase
MDISHPDYTLQAPPSTLQNILGGLRKVFTTDPALTLQVFLTIPIIVGGIVLQLNVIQWVLIVVVTLLFLLAGIFRTASLLQIKHDTSITSFHVTRIKCMGNALVTVMAGLSLFTYMMVFVPRIIQLL